MTKTTLSLQQLYTPSRLTNAQIKNSKKQPSIIGQKRALSALDFGLNIDAPRYNIYCEGEKGLGRTTLTLQKVREKAAKMPTPSDYCYVHNFDNPVSPIYVSLNPGRAPIFKKKMEETIHQVRKKLSNLWQNDSYKFALKDINDEALAAQEKHFAKIAKSIESKNVVLHYSAEGPTLFPAIDGKRLDADEFNNLPVSKRKPIMLQLEKAKKLIDKQLESFNPDAFKTKQIDSLHLMMVKPEVDNIFEPLFKFYEKHKTITTYLDAVRHDIVQDYNLFFNDQANVFRRFGLYQVNINSTHTPKSGAPVVHLTFPTVQNLLGKIERPYANNGDAEFMNIQSGALHRANGGYLLIEMQTVNPGSPVWDLLKQSLYANKIEMQVLPEHRDIFTSANLKPQSIPLSIKVILIRNYCDTFLADEDFPELFKVPVVFSTNVERTQKNEEHYAYILQDKIKKEKLKPFTPDAIRKLVELAVRDMGFGGRLSIRLSRIYDLMREANFLSTGPSVSDADIRKVQRQRLYHLNEPHDNYLNRIKTNDIVLDLNGYKISQINGLVVSSWGPSFEYGKPSRITAQIHAGNGKITSVDDSVGLTGTSARKSFLVLSALLMGRYGRHMPFPLDVSLSSEQSYISQNGDSASAAELLCILSAIGEIPLHQGTAITGSVDQLGNINPIGGVNEKIEGFYQACKTAGIDKTQGVVIPRINVPDLMLDTEIIEAVRAGKFRIYAVDTIDDAFEAMAGKKIAELNKLVEDGLKKYTRAD